MLSDNITILVGTTKGAFLISGGSGRSGWRVSGPHCGGWPINHLTGDAATGTIWAGGGGDRHGAGAPHGNEARYLDTYRRHNGRVVDFFAARAGQLLVLDITRGEGWENLCPFLGVEPPSAPFPHENRASPRFR